MSQCFLTDPNLVILWLDQTPMTMSHKPVGFHAPPHRSPEHKDMTIMYVYLYQ